MRSGEPCHVGVNGLRGGDDVKKKIVEERLSAYALCSTGNITCPIGEGQRAACVSIAQRFDSKSVDQQKCAAPVAVDNHRAEAPADIGCSRFRLPRIPVEPACRLAATRGGVVASATGRKGQYAVAKRDIDMPRIPLEHQSRRLEAARRRVRGHVERRIGDRQNVERDPSGEPRHHQTRASATGAWLRNRCGLAVAP